MKTNVIVLLLLIMPQVYAQKSESSHGTHRTDAYGNYVDSVNSGLIPKDTLKGSPHRVAMEFIGSNHVHIEYGSPGVKKRTIWGGLVAYNEVWATGAHKATSIEFSEDVIIGSKIIPAGKYAFFTIPGKEAWTIILNKNWDQHLADEYSDQDDIIRITVTPEVSDKIIQRLTYTVNQLSNVQGEVVMVWEYVRIRLPFKNVG